MSSEEDLKQAIERLSQDLYRVKDERNQAEKRLYEAEQYEQRLVDERTAAYRRHAENLLDIIDHYYLRGDPPPFETILSTHHDGQVNFWETYHDAKNLVGR